MSGIEKECENKKISIHGEILTGSGISILIGGLCVQTPLISLAISRSLEENNQPILLWVFLALSLFNILIFCAIYVSQKLIDKTNLPKIIKILTRYLSFVGFLLISIVVLDYTYIGVFLIFFSLMLLGVGLRRSC